MYCIPPSIQVSKQPNENFYFTFDVLANSDVKYQNSFKLSVDRFMIKKMDTLKKLVNERSLRMTFELGFVLMNNFHIMNKVIYIRLMCCLPIEDNLSRSSL